MHPDRRPVSHISQAYPDRVAVRGRDLTGDLMGRLSFTEYFHLLLCGEEPTEEQRYFLDLLLVAIAEHGMMPTNVAARMTLAADPGSLQGAVAAGILGCGPVILGTSEACARLLVQAQERVAAGTATAAAAADEAARAVRTAGERLPGFGHPVHKPLDPRAERILELADARGASGPHVALARHFRDAAAAAWGRPLTMNVSMPIAAVMLDVGFPAAAVKAVPILARTASLLAHLAEERELPAGLTHGRDRRRRGRVRRAMSAPSAEETRPWEEQRAADDAHYRAQLAYLFERSPFYRAKLADVGSAEAAGGLADIAALPLTEKQEVKATCTPEAPIGAHLCAAPEEIARIYSTSGTTGTPSYVPLTAGDIEHWVTGSARSYAASGVRAGQRIVSTYNAGPFAAGAALAAFERIGLCHVPVGTGNSERLMRAVELLRPEAAVLTPSYAAYLVEWAAERGVDLRASSVERVLVAGEPGGGEPAFRAALEEGWGARVTEAMGIGDIGVSLWGECEAQDGMHLGARGFVHPELIDPATGAPVPAGGRGVGRARADPPAPPRRAAAALPHARPRRGAHGPVPLRPHRPAHPLHRAAPTTC